MITTVSPRGLERGNPALTTNSMRQGVKEARNLMLWEKLKHYEVAGKIQSSRMENKGKSKTGKVLNMVAKRKPKITK